MAPSITRNTGEAMPSADLWSLVFVYLHILITRMAGGIGGVFSHRFMLVSQAVLSLGLSFFCSLDTLLGGSWHMGVVVCILGVINYLAYFASDQLRIRVETFRASFIVFPFVVDCAGIISVLAAFVFITESIGKHQGLDIYAFGFFMGVYINVTTIAKLFRTDDLFGVGDSIMALTVSLLIINREVLEISYVKHAIFGWLIACLLQMFKMAPIRVLIDQPGLPIQEDANVQAADRPRSIFCKFWKVGICNRGELCRFIHTWSTVPGIVLRMPLARRHKREIKGMAFPLNSEVLYSVSSDGCLQIWERINYHPLERIDLMADAGSLISAGSWVFVGMRDKIQVYDIQINTQSTLTVHGLVTALAFANQTLIAGTSAGQIVIWKVQHGINVRCPFGQTRILRGVHNDEVTCLTVGAHPYLYSGSSDRTIKMWDLTLLECIGTREVHTDTVTSLSWSHPNVLSSSLDGTIKAVDFSHNLNSGVVTNRSKSDGVFALFGMCDSTNQRILLCSSGTGSVSVYNLPGFYRRGKFVSKASVLAFAVGPNGEILTGDRNGNINAWSLTA